MTELIECVPNFSEGRDAGIIQQIVDAIAAIDGVHVLDHSSDHDHNRTVVTFIGDARAIMAGALAGVTTASKLIDLDRHTGVHPRIGATDVVPLIPLRDVTMQTCIRVAQGLGRRIAEELVLPVYLYENAALREDRRNLADVRRHPYEKLKTSIQSDPARFPDYGPHRLGKAGAVAVGARDSLIAFNAYLDTDDVSVAQAIAVAVRESGGGLPYLKALGLSVAGQAQVSMNVVDYRQTSLHTILERVRSEAARHGRAVTHTELVGLIPQAALLDAALAYLGLPSSARDLTLEGRIGAATGDFREVIFE